MVKDTFVFKSGYKVKMSLTDNPNEIEYRFYNNGGEEVKVIHTGLPTHVTNRSHLVLQIKAAVNPDGNVKSDEVNHILIELNKIISVMQGEAELKLIREKQNRDLEIRKKAHEAKQFIEHLNQPLLYVGSIVDWLTAGERINTLICFVAGCSQIILKEPVSVIGYGESSSGKTFVQKVALSLLPEEFVEVEKQVSPAALFNRAAMDTCFYDGKIVSYGDMGGQNDRDNLQDTLELMKELQSDGFLKKPVSVKQADGKWGVEDLILEGRPSLWYTTVPADIDGQELSRAIIYSPRTDNKEIFHRMNTLLSLKNGKTYKKYKEIEGKTQLVQHIVLHLREVMEEYVVIDPYYPVIANFLENSRYYKRDVSKYLGLLDTITVINFYCNPKYVFEDGQKAVITSKNDVRLLLSLLEPYLPSIAENIKPKSRDIYTVLRENIYDWKLRKGAGEDGYNASGFQVGITVAEYFEKSDKEIPLSSLYNYFKDLRDEGLLTVVGNENRSALYDVVEYNFDAIINKIDYDEIADTVELELGKEIADIIRNDVVDEDLDITLHHVLVEDVLW